MHIPLSKVYVDKQIKQAVLQVLDSGHYILGQECSSFEKEFAQYIGTRHAVLVGSGTAAIWLTLMALGVKPGDEIIVPSLTAFPTIEPILALAAKPVFADIDNTYVMDYQQIKTKITKKTKGIIPVHLYGHPANMGEILKLAHRYDLFALEDCCQAHGAKFKNKKVGSMGIAGCFSFYPSKNLTVCGDGGIITTNSQRIDKTLRMLRDHGRSSKYIHASLGYNERFNEIQAAIGRKLLKKLDSFNERRRQIAGLYKQNLKGLPLELPEETDWAYHVYHMFVIRIKNRDKLKEKLAKANIGSGIHYPVPAHLQPPILKKYGKINLPVTEKYCQEILSLPMHPMMKDVHVEFVCKSIHRFLKQIRG